MLKYFIGIRDLDLENAHRLLERAKEMKSSRFTSDLLAGKTIVMIFEKASTRTRLSFEVGIRQLGGQSIFMTTQDSQLGRDEPLADTARVLSRYNDGIVMRTFGQEKIEAFIRYGSIPVINALTDQGHPCQVMGDVFTIYERTPDFSSLRVAWIGDGNNMANSWIEASMVFPFTLTLACPEGYSPNMKLLETAQKAGAKVTLVRDPKLAATGAHYMNTDVWASMGMEKEQKAREKAFAGYRVDADLMGLAHPEVKFMHCLPAHQGEEVTAEIFEGSSSIVFDQAENRLHMQKAIMEWVFS